MATVVSCRHLEFISYHSTVLICTHLYSMYSTFVCRFGATTNKSQSTARRQEDQLVATLEVRATLYLTQLYDTLRHSTTYFTRVLYKYCAGRFGPIWSIWSLCFQETASLALCSAFAYLYHSLSALSRPVSTAKLPRTEWKLASFCFCCLLLKHVDQLEHLSIQYFGEFALTQAQHSSSKRMWMQVTSRYKDELKTRQWQGNCFKHKQKRWIEVRRIEDALSIGRKTIPFCPPCIPLVTPDKVGRWEPNCNCPGRITLASWFWTGESMAAQEGAVSSMFFELVQQVHVFEFMCSSTPTVLHLQALVDSSPQNHSFHMNLQQTSICVESLSNSFSLLSLLHRTPHTTRIQIYTDPQTDLLHIPCRKNVRNFFGHFTHHRHFLLWGHFCCFGT